MNNRLLILGTAVLLICVGLSGCEQFGVSSEESRFVGTWKDDS